jgi:hypothetical protein
VPFRFVLVNPSVAVVYRVMLTLLLIKTQFPLIGTSAFLFSFHSSSSFFFFPA